MLFSKKKPIIRERTKPQEDTNMTAYELKRNHEKKHPSSHFFDQNTLDFFGETIQGMKVLANTAKCRDSQGEEHTCYVISTIQKNYPFGAKRAHHYFDTTTFEHVMTKTLASK